MTTYPAGTLLPRAIVYYENPDGSLTSAPPGGSTVDFTVTNSKLDTLGTLLTAANAYQDGMKTLAGATNTALGTLNTSISSLLTYSDGLETNTAATTSAVSAMSAKLPSTLGQTTKAGSLSVAIASDAAGQAQATPSFHRVTDGTNSVAVKAASTAPAATDPALVVALSPQSVLSRFRAVGTLSPTASITAGGMAQTALAANATRTYLLVQNNSAADLWVNFTNATAAVNAGVLVPAGQFYENPAHFSPVGAVSIYGATTGQAYTALEA